LEDSSFGLQPGGSKTIAVTVTVPTDAVLGDWDAAVIRVEMRSDRRHIDRSTLTTTAAEATRGVELTTADDTESALPGQSAAYTLTLTNTGNAVDSFDLTAAGNTWPGVTITPAAVTELAAGATATITVNVSVPADAGGTSDVVTITATSTADSTAVDSLDLTTTALLPDYGVALTADVTAQTILPGGTAVYTVTLTNTGGGTDSFDLTVAGLWPDITVEPITVSSLTAGQTATITVTVPAPAGYSGVSDTVTLRAVSQADDTVEASLELTTSIGWLVHLPLILK